MARADQSINSWNGPYIDAMYEQWEADPNSVEASLQRFFEGFDLGIREAEQAGETADDAPTVPVATATPSGGTTPSGGGTLSGGGGLIDVAHTKQGQVDALIYHYRDIGHFAADLDPLGTTRPFPEHLTLDSFGLGESDLDGVFDPGYLPLKNPSTLRDIIQWLTDTYCRHLGVEYMHIQDREVRRWLQRHMEGVRNCPPFSHDEKMTILGELIESDGFENFLHMRYRGKKRFGLDGGESLIPMLRSLVDHGPEYAVEEFTIGMAHRGRLNVLVNILQKSYDQIFTEFHELWVEDFTEGGGDVKYHCGYSSDHQTPSGHNVRLTLSPNPSHLEFGHAVVLGRARAKQRLREDLKRERCVPILIHGDASFPGQGIVAEMLNMARLDGYNVGGAVHIVINNQIGFTTDPADAHSGKYCTDLAKMIDAPIFHVNGDDPEACVFAAKVAIEYRQVFKNDVIIDLWCYRKYGHNEGDEPTFTQPLMYKRIAEQEPTLQKYAKRLIEEGQITQTQFDQKYLDVKESMDAAQSRAKETPVETTVRAFSNIWAGLSGAYNDDPVETAAPHEQLEMVAAQLGSTPESFTPHRKLARLLKTRGESVINDQPLDWAMGELLAYGTLLADGHAVRLTGQDVERGTFSHRHCTLTDQETGEQYIALNNLTDDQAKFCVHNSPLTESACVGFEYGYSLGDPKMLIIWEAQFGDFANGAQVFFDQFIASAEIKWKRYSGLTLFLPHGYEGQGPEHSSARPERFLQLCADNNMQVVYPTTPAQMFHMLRRQMKRSFRKPLVVMTPKSLLRHKEAVSSVAELTSGGFRQVIDDGAVVEPQDVRRLILCTGKVYYDLAAKRNETERKDVAIVRIEQLYPFEPAHLKDVMARYPGVEEVVWAQEEPRNMGAWTYMQAKLYDVFGMRAEYAGRDENASPAVASMRMHEHEQGALVDTALGKRSEPDRQSGSRRVKAAS